MYICGSDSSQSGECYSGVIHNTSQMLTKVDCRTDEENFGYKDATWVMTSSIMVFQMQTGKKIIVRNSY